MKRTLVLIVIGILILSFDGKAQTQPKVTITAPLSVWQLILKALDKLPREESNDVYQYIVSEANRQLNPPVKSDSTAPKKPIQKSNN